MQALFTDQKILRAGDEQVRRRAGVNHDKVGRYRLRFDGMAPGKPQRSLHVPRRCHNSDPARTSAVPLKPLRELGHFLRRVLTADHLHTGFRNSKLNQQLFHFAGGSCFHSFDCECIVSRADDVARWIAHRHPRGDKHPVAGAAGLRLSGWRR